MTDRNEQQVETADPTAAAAPGAPAPEAATAEATTADAMDAAPPGTITTPDGEKKPFVPFFNEEYEFKLGSLGDTATAYRLGAIFLLMLIGAALMYLGAWWWVGTHPLAQH